MFLILVEMFVALWRDGSSSGDRTAHVLYGQ